MTSELVKRLRKGAVCIHIAVEESVAEDIADMLTKAADALSLPAEDADTLATRDAMLTGTGFVRQRADGTRERIPPEEVFIHTPPADEGMETTEEERAGVSDNGGYLGRKTFSGKLSALPPLQTFWQARPRLRPPVRPHCPPDARAVRGIPPARCSNNTIRTQGKSTHCRLRPSRRRTGEGEGTAEANLYGT